MKKSTKVWLIAAVGLMVAGLVVSMIGLGVLGLDFTKLGTQNMVTNTYEPEESFSQIRMDLITTDVAFVPSEDGKAKVVCFEEEKMLHTVQVENNILVIRQKDDRQWYDYIGISVATPKLTVYLPASEYEELQIDCSTGKVNMPADFKFQDVRLDLTTGDVMWKADVAQTLSVHTTTGRVTTEGVQCGNLDIKTATGAVKLLETQAETTLTVIVTTGNVKLSRVDAGELSIETTTGNVSGTLLSSKVFIAETSTGNVDVPNSTSGGKCQITTSTGNIEITIE